LFFACALSLYVGAELLISTRLALFAQRQWQSDFAEANFFVSMFFLFLLVGRVSFIFWQPKGRLRNHLWLSLSLTSISLVLGLLGWKWGFSLAGLFMAPVYPLMMTAAGQMFSKQIYRVTAFAISMSNVSVLVMHGLFGQLSDVYGIQIAMWGAVFLSGTSILLICLHPLVFKRSYP
jgi:fucose permease